MWKWVARLLICILPILMVACSESDSGRPQGSDDHTPPQVVYGTRDGIGINEPITVVFSEPVDASTITASTFLVSDGVNGPISYIAETRMALMHPNQLLAPSSSYTITITSGVKDIAGNAMTGHFFSTFTTGSLVTTGSWEPMSGRISWTGLETAVWTGTKVIDFGGFTFGGMYDPVLDSWSGISYVNMPIGREGHTGIWSGEEMIIWGGTDQTNHLNSGGRYDPSRNTWTTMSTANAPSPRRGHTAVWADTVMIVWGGTNGVSQLNTGAIYHPSTDTWTPISAVGAPAGRIGHAALWTGREMIVWGGTDVYDGARYNPITDTWTSVSSVGAPSGQTGQSTIWTGEEMIVWGQGDIAGARYDPGNDTWSAIGTDNAPAPTRYHSAVWTGAEMIVWGGIANDVVATGGRYNPQTNTWQVVCITGSPSPRNNHFSVWTGTEMLIWGGSLDEKGGRYSP